MQNTNPFSPKTSLQIIQTFYLDVSWENLVLGQLIIPYYSCLHLSFCLILYRKRRNSVLVSHGSLRLKCMLHYTSDYLYVQLIHKRGLYMSYYGTFRAISWIIQAFWMILTKGEVLCYTTCVITYTCGLYTSAAYTRVITVLLK